MTDTITLLWLAAIPLILLVPLIWRDDEQPPKGGAW